MRLSAAVFLLPLWLSPCSALAPSPRHTYCSIFKKPVLDKQNCLPEIPSAFVEDGVGSSNTKSTSPAGSTPLELAYGSLVVLQKEFWAQHRGDWPRAIDWTAAFIHTSLSGMTDTLSRGLGGSYADDFEASMIRNMIDSYFTQIVGFYFGQNHMSLRHQAFDDILWVVLGWLESTSLIKSHSALHYYAPEGALSHKAQLGLEDALISQPWHGNDWMESFAHRARIFWELATQGWGEALCGGGMRWSPHLLVYKNAITNQLWIAASARMYLDYPGDGIASPYSGGHEARNRTYLEFAVKGYEWLLGVNMTNPAGLFVDGYHISRHPRNNTKCDVREESVYTYNQGVLLTGHRGLWEATGSPSYLKDGHQLIQNVILATGWDLREGGPFDKIRPGKLPPWRGIGRAGVLEERCDSIGRCSQNGHTFKGIYFHHLTYFCAPISKSKFEVDDNAFEAIASAHAKACATYLPWIVHNAEAALSTRDSRGVIGMWWGAEKYGRVAEVWESDDPTYLDRDTSDYRNFGIPDDDVWTEPRIQPDPLPGVDPKDDSTPDSSYQDESDSQQRVIAKDANKFRDKDPNKRGRGRTVETQNSGMMVLRAWWELSQWYGEKEEEGEEGWSFGMQWLVSGLLRLWHFGTSFF